MKKVILLFITVISFFACDGMNDGIQEYLDRGEINYLGKPDSVMVFGGYNRVKFTWIVGSDPRIENLRVLWNDKQDTLTYKIVKSELGPYEYVSTIFENIPEGTYIFYAYHTGSKGYDSIMEEVTCEVYGDNYQANLSGRRIRETSETVDGFLIGWGGTLEGMVKSVLIYDVVTGGKAEIEVMTSETETLITDYLPGGTYYVRTDYLPEEDAIDIFSVFSEEYMFADN